MSDVRFSWNLLADVREMWSLPFMVTAFRAGTIVAVLAAVVGWFMVTRRQSFTGHTLSVVGFPGAAAAVWLGLPVTGGYLAAALLAAVALAVVPQQGRGEESAATGTVQALALSSGFLFLALHGGLLEGATSLLFGSALGISPEQVLGLLVLALTVLGILAVCGRPLLFASLDPAVAAAHGVPVRLLGAGFLLLLAATAAMTAQVTGSLLVFALMVLPPATAQLATARPARALLVTVGIGCAVVWASLTMAFYTAQPLGFWLTSIAFGVYLLAATGAQLRRLAGRRRPGLRRPALGAPS